MIYFKNKKKNDLQIRSDDLVDFNLDQVNYKIFAKRYSCLS